MGRSLRATSLFHIHYTCHKFILKGLRLIVGGIAVTYNTIFSSFIENSTDQSDIRDKKYRIYFKISVGHPSWYKRRWEESMETDFTQV